MRSLNSLPLLRSILLLLLLPGEASRPIFPHKGTAAARKLFSSLGKYKKNPNPAEEFAGNQAAPSLSVWWHPMQGEEGSARVTPTPGFALPPAKGTGSCIFGEQHLPARWVMELLHLMATGRDMSQLSPGSLLHWQTP